jgi:Arm DNA-binding domain
MAEHPLTAESIARAQCRNAPYVLKDVEGLYLWVTPTAGKLWRWNYNFGGQARIMAYGEWPRVSLERARTEHAKAQRLLAEGIDPMSWKKAVAKRAKHLRAARQEEKRLLREMPLVLGGAGFSTDAVLSLLRTA